MSQGVTTGLFALGGVIIGGLLNIATELALAWQGERKAKESTLRLISSELGQLAAKCTSAYDWVTDDAWEGLPLGLVRGPAEWTEWDTTHWEKHSERLAVVLDDMEWALVDSSYRRIKMLRDLLLSVEASSADWAVLRPAVRAVAYSALEVLKRTSDAIAKESFVRDDVDSLSAS